jgi:hypothetical protein
VCAGNEKKREGEEKREKKELPVRRSRGKEAQGEEENNRREKKWSR